MYVTAAMSIISTLKMFKVLRAET